MTYPIYTKLCNETYPLLQDSGDEKMTFSDVRKYVTHAVHELEHGVANVEEALGITLEQYSAVAGDLLRTIYALNKMEREG